MWQSIPSINNFSLSQFRSSGTYKFSHIYMGYSLLLYYYYWLYLMHDEGRRVLVSDWKKWELFLKGWLFIIRRGLHHTTSTTKKSDLNLNSPVSPVRCCTVCISHSVWHVQAGAPAGSSGSRTGPTPRTFWEKDCVLWLSYYIYYFSIERFYFKKK